MMMSRANFKENAASERTTAVPCDLLSHELVLTSSRESATVRIHGRGAEALYVSLPPERALAIGGAFLLAALRLDHSLREKVTALLGKIEEGA